MQTGQAYRLKNSGSFLLAIIMVLEWFALPAQFYLLIHSNAFTWAEAVVRFFSFFTVLTNTMVVVCCTIFFLGKRTWAYQFFSRYTTLTAITVYILIVGMVYNILLRPLQHLQGLHRVTTEIFHTAVPILFLLYWLFFTAKHYIPWKKLLPWLVYPLTYVVYTLLHGWYTNFYPYPFIDITKLGFARAMTNGLYVLLSFVIVAVILVGPVNYREKRRPVRAAPCPST